MAIGDALHDGEASSLTGGDERRPTTRANRPPHGAKELVKTVGTSIVLLGLVLMAIYVVLNEKLFRTSCDTDAAYSPPYIEHLGILELTWETLPIAIKRESNLAIIEHNAECGPLNVSTLLPLRCKHLKLAIMPHSTFSFHSTCATTAGQNAAAAPEAAVPCFGLRWIANNELDTYHGPFATLAALQLWFDSVTSDEYEGCLGKRVVAQPLIAANAS